MDNDHDACYRALLARDARFDGVFFVGVTTTGIYCRPICTARTPGRSRCRFFPSAAAAEQAHFRPCLRCRPELAPGQAPMDSPRRTALLAAARIQEGALSGGRPVAQLARELGVGARQLRRVTKEFLGASPVELAQTQRLLLAKQLLTETRLPIIHVAQASGFASLRRFNALFRDHYRLAPRGLRHIAGRATSDDTLRLSLGYRPPLAWREMLAFLRPRALAGVELVTEDAYLRSVALGKQQGWVKVTAHRQRPQLVVELPSSLLRILPELLVRLRNLFDLNARPDVIAACLQIDPRLRAAVRRWPGLRVPGCFDGFELVTRAILGQQTSVRSASASAGRLATAYGQPLSTPFPELCRLTPTAAAVAAATGAGLAALGIPVRRAETIVAVASAVVARQLSFTPGAPPEATMNRLCEIPGVGDWTAQYTALRALRWPDAFPAGDLVLKRTLGQGSEKRAREAAEAWRPWRGYGAMYLWMSQLAGEPS